MPEYSHSQRILSLLKNPRYKAIFVFFCVLILVIIAVIITEAFSKKESADSAATNFLNYVLKGESNEAYSLASQSFKTATSASSFSAIVQNVDQQCANNFYEKISNEYLSTASLFFNSPQYLGGTCHFQVELIKNSNLWQVSFFNEY